MKTQRKAAMMFVVVVMHAAIVLNPALADRFYVALVLPLSGPAAVNGDEIRKGFLLATTQRDAHADEESNGHLGNLDSYVSIIDANGDVEAEIRRLLSIRQINIVASFASDKTQGLTGSLLAGKKLPCCGPAQHLLAIKVCRRFQGLFPLTTWPMAKNPPQQRRKVIMLPDALIKPSGLRAASMTWVCCVKISDKQRPHLPGKS